MIGVKGLELAHALGVDASLHGKGGPRIGLRRRRGGWRQDAGSG